MFGDLRPVVHAGAPGDRVRVQAGDVEPRLGLLHPAQELEGRDRAGAAEAAVHGAAEHVHLHAEGALDLADRLVAGVEDARVDGGRDDLGADALRAQGADVVRLVPHLPLADERQRGQRAFGVGVERAGVAGGRGDHEVAPVDEVRREGVHARGAAAAAVGAGPERRPPEREQHLMPCASASRTRRSIVDQSYSGALGSRGLTGASARSPSSTRRSAGRRPSASSCPPRRCRAAPSGTPGP